MRPAAILHLSDLHIGHPNRYGKEPYTTFKDKLSSDLMYLKKSENSAPNILAITGDITNRSLEREYRQAYSFLVDITKKLKIERKATLLVPGNHDINWDLCQAYFSQQKAKELEPQRPYFPKFGFYQKFFNEFYEGIGISFDNELFVGYNLNQFNLLVVGLNSCEYESHRDTDHYGWISVKQAQEAAQWCEQIDPQRKQLRIALLHHNLLRGSNYDNENLKNFGDIQSIFEEFEITIFLHGHRHQRTMQRLDPLTGKQSLYVLAAGAAGLDKNVIGDIPSGYQILNIDKGQVTLYLRRYDPHQSGLLGKGTFIPDVDKDGRWKYSFEIEKAKDYLQEFDKNPHPIERLLEEPRKPLTAVPKEREERESARHIKSAPFLVPFSHNSFLRHEEI